MKVHIPLARKTAPYRDNVSRRAGLQCGAAAVQFVGSILLQREYES